MAKKFVNELRKGDVIVFEDGDIQSIKSVNPGSKRTVVVEMQNGKVMITDHTTQFPVVSSKVDIDLSIEEMYNLILDDNMSLTDFTLWCTKKR